MNIQSDRPNNTETLTAGYIQFDVEAGDISANLQKVEEGLRGLSATVSALLVLPELWATGFDYPRLYRLAAETPKILARLQTLCSRYNCWLAGSLPEPNETEGRVFNTLYVTGPEGVSGSYRKQQLFSPMLEDKYFTPGANPAPIPSGAGLLAALVCYDLRFADLAGRLCTEGARLLLVSAQWPMARLSHWQTLLKARAIENQIHVIACNRYGTTGDTLFAGHSAIIGPDGTVLSEAEADGPAAETVTLDMAKQEEIRRRFQTVGGSPFRHDDKDKIVSLEQAQSIVRRNRELGRRTVFTNGCFDILHAGHAVYLEQARKQGDCLIVGLNSDRSIRAIKGPDRPVNGEEDRARVLAALGCVDLVVLFEEETPLALIRELLPDVLVKGADWAEEDIVGAKEVKEAGGRVVRVPLVDGRSTTGVIKKLQDR
jgi:rfaE bifunctional protein nucleotidyltransferase chain/domain